MIDIGTIPMKNSISKLMFYMMHSSNKNCGGVAGEIEVFKPDDEKKKQKCFDKIEASVLFYT